MSTTEINPDLNNFEAILEEKKREAELPTPYKPAGVAGVVGEFALDSGPRVPWFKIIQNVGKSSADFPTSHGGLLYHEKTIVPQPAIISFFGLRGYYVQNLAFDASRLERPKIYDTVAEIEAAGGNVTPFTKPGMDDNNYIPAALVFLILEAPDNAKSWAKGLEFAAPFEKKLFLPACYNIRSTQYRTVVPVVRTLSEALKRDGSPLFHARYHFSTRLSPVGGNFVYIPILKRLEDDNSDNFAPIAAGLFGEA
jgi:hypothetical protein